MRTAYLLICILLMGVAGGLSAKDMPQSSSQHRAATGRPMDQARPGKETTPTAASSLDQSYAKPALPEQVSSSSQPVLARPKHSQRIHAPKGVQNGKETFWAVSFFLSVVLGLASFVGIFVFLAYGIANSSTWMLWAALGCVGGTLLFLFLALVFVALLIGTAAHSPSPQQDPGPQVE